MYETRGSGDVWHCERCHSGRCFSTIFSSRNEDRLQCLIVAIIENNGADMHSTTRRKQHCTMCIVDTPNECVSNRKAKHPALKEQSIGIPSTRTPPNSHHSFKPPTSLHQHPSFTKLNTKLDLKYECKFGVVNGRKGKGHSSRIHSTREWTTGVKELFSLGRQNWKNNTDQTYSCPRDLRFWCGQLREPLKAPILSYGGV